jgi:hypothetical protein
MVPSPSPLKTYERRQGTAYPGVAWDLKPAFDIVAAFYARN